MKKLFYVAIAALTLAACAKELVPQNESKVPMVEVSFTATINKEDITKAEVNMTSGATTWDNTDAIAVHTVGGKLATLYAKSSGTSVTFTGEIESGDEIADGAIAYYPASIAIAGAANIDKINMPASYASPALAAKGFPLQGVLSGSEIEFKHIGALLKVTVNKKFKLFLLSSV